MYDPEEVALLIGGPAHGDRIAQLTWGDPFDQGIQLSDWRNARAYVYRRTHRYMNGCAVFTYRTTIPREESHYAN